MDALEFMIELKRMCNSHIIGRVCNIDCPLYDSEFCTIGHRTKTEKSMAQAVNIVEKWSKENPVKIDWRKVPKDTKVKVSNVDGKKGVGIEGYFCCYLPNAEKPFYKYEGYDTSETAEDIDNWKYCQLVNKEDIEKYKIGG